MLPPPPMIQEILDKPAPREGHTVLDVGTGVGWLASPAADRVKPTGTVFVLEPTEDS